MMTDGTTTFVAFLFNADHKSFSMDYGSPCEQAFVEALAASDQEMTCNVRIRRGDVLSHQLASKLSRLVLTPKPPGARITHATESRHHRTDKRALSIIVGDVTDSLESAWTSLDLIELPSYLAMQLKLPCRP